MLRIFDLEVNARCASQRRFDPDEVLLRDSVLAWEFSSLQALTPALSH